MSILFFTLNKSNRNEVHRTNEATAQNNCNCGLKWYKFRLRNMVTMNVGWITLLNLAARHLNLNHPNKPLQYEDIVPMSGILHILTIGIGLVEPVDENWVAHFQTGHVGDLIQLNESISVHIQGFHNFVHIQILEYKHCC